MKKWIATASHTAGKREVYNKLECGGSPTFEQLHSLPSVQFTLLSFSSPAELPEQFDAGRGQSSDMQPCNRSPVLAVAAGCPSPTVTRRAGRRLGARAASAAEAGVVLVAAELCLQDQITVGEVGLVHALTAQVHNAIHSSVRPAPQHLHLCAGTDGVAAAVGAACVGSLISLLNIADD